MAEKSSRKSAKQVKASKRSSDRRRNVSKPRSAPGLRRIKQPGPELQQLLDDASAAQLIEPVAKLRLEQAGAEQLLERLWHKSGSEVETIIGSLPEPLAETLLKVFNDEPGTVERRSVRVAVRYNEILQAEKIVHRLVKLFRAGETGYIRHCAACGRWFFAGRIDAWGCSKPCNTRNRKARWKKQFDKGNPKYHKEYKSKRKGEVKT